MPLTVTPAAGATAIAAPIEAPQALLAKVASKEGKPAWMLLTVENKRVDAPEAVAGIL